MNLKKSIAYFLHNLREKHRVSIRNLHSDREVWYMYISPLNLLAGLLALILVLFIIITTTVAYTPILDLIPGYPGNKSRTLLIENIVRLDSLEQEIRNMQIYSENISLIMAGKNPVTRNNVTATDTSKKNNSIIASIVEDSILRSQMERAGGIYSLNDPQVARRSLRNAMDLFTPVKGVVTERFSPIDHRYGVTLAVSPDQQVMAVMDGTVISSSWSPENGFSLMIQHIDNMLSIYRHNTSVLKKTGDRVSSGEIIGYAGGETPSNDTQQNIFEFELWQNGIPIDPERFVVF